MKIKEALSFFLELKRNTEKKAELKLYNKYIGILFDLTNRDLTESQVSLVEKKIKELDFKGEYKNKNKFLSKKLFEFLKFLKDKFNLILEGHYTSYGLVFGMLFGFVVGFYFEWFSMLSGMAIGMIAGMIMDLKAKKEGRVLKKELPKEDISY